MTQKEKAAQLFNSGYHCAHSVYLACRDQTLMPERTAVIASGAFGSGVGGMEQTCGALCASMMVLYERFAPQDPTDSDQKRWVRVILQDFGLWFENRYGTCMCQLLRPQSQSQPNGYRICTDYVEACAQKLCEIDIPYCVKRIAYGSPDYEKALLLRQAVLRAPLGLDLFSEDLAGEADAVHFGAFMEDKLIGTMFLQPVTPAKMQLRQVAVNDAYRHIGAGRLMMRFAEFFAKEQGVSMLYAHVRKTAEAFYASLGYRAAGDDFIEAGIGHVLMEKAL